MAELTYGNYDYIRAAGAITGPISETLAVRLDGVYVQRDGFYDDRSDQRHRATSTTATASSCAASCCSSRTTTLSVRLIGDYTTRDEACCGAVYLDRDFNPLIGNLNEPATPSCVGGAANPNGNNIINVLRDLGQPLGRLQRSLQPRHLRHARAAPIAARPRTGAFRAQVD